MIETYPPDSKSAPYYDLIYSFKDYSAESEELASTIRKEHPRAQNLLDVACGTHEHAVSLSKHFSVDGVDLSSDYIAIAKNKNPRGHYCVGDMRRFDNGRRYDVVTCLQSSIGYLKNQLELRTALERFAMHLKPGGLLLIEPWFFPETFEPGKTGLEIGKTSELKVARASVRTLTEFGSLMQFHFVVVRSSGVEIFREDHHLSLFSRSEIELEFKRLGLTVRHDATWSRGRGLFVGKMD